MIQDFALEEADEQIARYAAAKQCDELTAARQALAERLRVNVGLMAENAQLKKPPVRSGASEEESTGEPVVDLGVLAEHIEAQIAAVSDDAGELVALAAVLGALRTLDKDQTVRVMRYVAHAFGFSVSWL